MDLTVPISGKLEIGWAAPCFETPRYARLLRMRAERKRLLHPPEVIRPRHRAKKQDGGSARSRRLFGVRSDHFGILHLSWCLSWSFSTMVATVFSRYSSPSFTVSCREKFWIGMWLGPNLKLPRTDLKSAFSAARRISSFLVRSPFTALTTLSSSGTA